MELIFTRPLGFLALSLPLVLLVVSRLRREPSVVATGTLAVWREIEAGGVPVAEASRPRVPPIVWLFWTALVLGALALAGPRVVSAEGPRTWTVFVDATSAGRLEWTPMEQGEQGDPGSEAREVPDAAGSSRIERSFRLALAHLQASAEPTDRVRWVRADGEAREGSVGEVPDDAWLFASAAAASRAVGAGLRASLDVPGAIWVTDRAPSERPAFAAWFAAGGGAVPGPVASDGESTLVWDGASVTARAAERGARGRLVLDETEAPLPALVADLAEIWTGARGVILSRGGDVAEARLVLRGEGRSPDLDPEPVAEIASRDGWSVGLRGTAVVPPAAGESVWLVAGRGDVAKPVVSWRPGLVRVGARGMDPSSGDPARLAVSFAELLDAAYPAPPEVASLADRAPIGTASIGDGAAPLPTIAPSNRWTQASLDAWLAGVAALIALAGLALWRG